MDHLVCNFGVFLMNIQTIAALRYLLQHLYKITMNIQADLCSLITFALPDGPFSFSSLSSVSPRRLRSSVLTLRSR